MSRFGTEVDLRLESRGVSPSEFGSSLENSVAKVHKTAVIAWSDHKICRSQLLDHKMLCSEMGRKCGNST